MPPRIFISYRRDDAAGDAGRLADHLHRRFGSERVFVDVDAIAPGTDFVATLRKSLEQTAAMLVVIGPRWLSLRAADGTRRLDDPNDFVRLEIETALGRGIPTVPVLVQGAALPRPEELPASLVPLLTRQTVELDHAGFHDDVERLCDWLTRTIADSDAAPRSLLRRWPAVAAAALLTALGLALAGSFLLKDDAAQPASNVTEQDHRADALVGEATEQRRRGQYVEAVATLARARQFAPQSEVIRHQQEDVAMQWLREVRFESGKSSFGEAIKPALAVIDAALPSATGARRADLLAHSAWAGFLLWRDGNRQIDPGTLYEEALAADSGNPYANAMFAHWILFRGTDVPRASKLFATALQSGRATDEIRRLQWAAYGNARTPEADAELVRVADAMRRNGKRLSVSEAQRLFAPYYTTARIGSDKERRVLLDAVPPDDHISTLAWALDDYAEADPSRRLIIRYHVALLHARAGRTGRAANDLKGLLQDLSGRPGSLHDAVEAALRQMKGQ